MPSINQSWASPSVVQLYGSILPTFFTMRHQSNFLALLVIIAASSLAAVSSASAGVVVHRQRILRLDAPPILILRGGATSSISHTILVKLRKIIRTVLEKSERLESPILYSLFKSFVSTIESLTSTTLLPNDADADEEDDSLVEKKKTKKKIKKQKYWQPQESEVYGKGN